MGLEGRGQESNIVDETRPYLILMGLAENGLSTRSTDSEETLT